MKAREASGKRYFTTKRKEVLLGSSQFRLGGARWSVIESFFIVIYETWLSHPEDVARKVSSNGNTDLQ